jgi:predicted enzyme related to lactoylglutathione lyase
MPTIVHFEIPADDIERSKKFYTDLFGWKIEKLSVADDSQLTSSYSSANRILDDHNNR